MRQQGLAGRSRAHLLPRTGRRVWPICSSSALMRRRYGRQRQRQGFGGRPEAAMVDDGGQGVKLSGIEHSMS